MTVVDAAENRQGGPASARTSLARTKGLRCRLILDSDAEAVGDLLKKGFGAQRTRRFWSNVFERLTLHPTPLGMPKYGYLLESDGRVVGAILLISSAVHTNGDDPVRANVSSWYVEPEFRSYGSLLVSNALKRKGVTYLNISPAPHTRQLLQAQGYTLYSAGLFISAPLFSKRSGGPVRVVAADATNTSGFEESERTLLIDHQRYGCVSVICETPEARYPFVFVRRVVRGMLPCFQLIYCRDISHFVQCSRSLGGYLARRGGLLVMVDSNGSIPGLVGRYFPGVRPKYFQGRHAPRLGDLAYTETAMFGV